MPKITCHADYYILCPDGHKLSLSAYAQYCQNNIGTKVPALLIIENVDYGDIDQYYVTDHPEIQNIKKETFPFWFIKKEAKELVPGNTFRVMGNAVFIIKTLDRYTTFGLSALIPYASCNTLVTIGYGCNEYQYPINKLLINGLPISSYNREQLAAICQSKNYTISCVPDEVPKVQRLPKFYVTGSKVFISNKGKYNLSDELLEFLTDQGIVRAFAVSHSVFSQELYDKLAKYKLNIEIMFDA